VEVDQRAGRFQQAVNSLEGMDHARIVHSAQ
jgi:hypothetical protein